jgi:hypothetical protein
MTTKIICRALNCIFNEAKRCISVAIIYDTTEGCLSYETAEDVIFDREEDEAEWEENDLLFADDDEGQGWEDDDLWAAEGEAELTEDMAEDEG